MGTGLSRLPSLLVAIAANQLPSAQALSQAGYVHFLGDLSSLNCQQVVSILQALLDHPSEGMPRNSLTDGWGVSRLATAMLGIQGELILRPAKETDEALLLRWANDPQVRANSFSSMMIMEDEHTHWFYSGLDNDNRLLFIALDIDGCPVGQIRFDLISDNEHSPAIEATVDISLDRSARGLGLAVEIIRLGLQEMEAKWGSQVEAIAEVLESNIASNNCFSRAGFSLESVEKDFSSNGHSSSVNLWRWRY